MYINYLAMFVDALAFFGIIYFLLKHCKNEKKND